MSGFSEQLMRDRLQKLSNTAHSIQTLSAWLQHHHKRHADAILDTWLMEVRSNTENDRLISLINLANDIIQWCKKKAPTFSASFYEVLAPAFTHAASTVDESHKKLIKRIILVWRDRQIYSEKQLEALVECLGVVVSPTNLNSDPESPMLKQEHSPSTSPEKSKRVKEEFQAFSTLSANLVAILRRLEDPASADVKIRQLIAAYPESIANPSLLKEIKAIGEVTELLAKINEATPVVENYCDRLSAELKDRQNLQNCLIDYTNALHEANERNKQLIISVRRRIVRLDEEKRELKQHIESLPDLTEMFGESSSTTLPSLGELFTSTS